jgi:hypothetical protein
MPGQAQPDPSKDLSATWLGYQTDRHSRAIELIQIWFAVVVLAVLTAAGLYLVLQPEASPDQVKLAYGWIGAVLGAATNMLRKP